MSFGSPDPEDLASQTAFPIVRDSRIRETTERREGGTTSASLRAMTLRLTEEQELALEALAGSQGISKQEATVRAILEAADCRLQCADVAELSACGRERKIVLLDRLAQ